MQKPNLGRLAKIIMNMLFDLKVFSSSCKFSPATCSQLTHFSVLWPFPWASGSHIQGFTRSSLWVAYRHHNWNRTKLQVSTPQHVLPAEVLWHSMAPWFFQLSKIKILVLSPPPFFLTYPTSYPSASPFGSAFKRYLDQFCCRSGS